GHSACAHTAHVDPQEGALHAGGAGIGGDAVVDREQGLGAEVGGRQVGLDVGVGHHRTDGRRPGGQRRRGRRTGDDGGGGRARGRAAWAGGGDDGERLAGRGLARVVEGAVGR